VLYDGMPCDPILRSRSRSRSSRSDSCENGWFQSISSPPICMQSKN